jgi:hypothetical protein
MEMASNLSLEAEAWLSIRPKSLVREGLVGHKLDRQLQYNCIAVPWELVFSSYHLSAAV